MIKNLQCLLIMVSIVVISACGKQFSSPTMLDEIAGVWRAGGDGAMVTIIYVDKKLSLLVNDHSIPISPSEVDTENKTVNLNVTTQDGKPGVWTIRQLWNANKDAFNLQLTLHDGTQDDLTFVRKISTNDLNKLANAEAKNSPAAISESVAANESASTAPAEAELVLDEKAPSAESSTSQPATFSPSFDCAKVSTGPERLICSSQELAVADVKLAQLYKTALQNSTDKETLKRDQIEWRKTSRDACADSNCILSAYNTRIKQLTQ